MKHLQVICGEPWLAHHICSFLAGAAMALKPHSPNGVVQLEYANDNEVWFNCSNSVFLSAFTVYAGNYGLTVKEVL